MSRNLGSVLEVVGPVVRALAAVALVALTALVPAQAGSKNVSSAGLVDGEAFRELAGEDDEVVEVNLAGPTLQALVGQRAEAELAGALRGLHSIRAFIVGLGGDAARIERAARLAVDKGKELRRQGWAAIVTVREKGSKVDVLTLSDGETIQGLVVIAVDDEQAVFVNIAGVLDLARLGDLSEVLDVPGLDAMGGKTKPKRESE